MRAAEVFSSGGWTEENSEKNKSDDLLFHSKALLCSNLCRSVTNRFRWHAPIARSGMRSFMNQEERIDLGPVYFRPITLEDTDRIIRWRNSDRVRKNFIDQRPFTRQGHFSWLETRVATGEVVQFILCETQGDRPVGSVYIRDIDRSNQKGEYGIFIGEEDAAGKGYGTLAAKGAIAYARDVLKLHKLILRVFADNAAAVKSYERAGFRREALLKDEIRRADGGWRDLILMAVLFPE